MIMLNDIYKESPTKLKSRLKIIDKAFDLFSKQGFDSFSLTDIAELSGITIRNLYRYYSSKEALITDVAFHSISKFNSTHPITLDITLTGYEQLRDVLQKQIEYKLLSSENHAVMTFIGYFDIYMTKSNLEHEALKHYIAVFAPLLKENLLESIKQALIKGVKDNTIIIEIIEVYAIIIRTDDGIVIDLQMAEICLGVTVHFVTILVEIHMDAVIACHRAVTGYDVVVVNLEVAEFCIGIIVHVIG